MSDTPTPSAGAVEETKAQIASFMRRLYDKGLTTSSGGNLSARLGGLVCITPSASDKGRMEASEIGCMDLDGAILGTPFKPSIETRMHLEIYKRRPDICAIVHAHPPFSSAIAATGAGIDTSFLSETYAILGQVAYAPYRRMGSPELAAEVAETATASNCLLMRNHGALTVGRSLLEAFDRLEVLEAAARVNLLLAGPLEGHGRRLSSEELAAIDVMMGR